MKNNKGIASILIVLIVVGVLVLGGGTYYLLTKNSRGSISCTQEAKLCPDGSYVSRTGSNCEFAECPVAPGCKNLWWYDSQHNSCQQPKQFCGAYMYQGLQTFETKEACENSLVTAGWKTYRNGELGIEFKYPKNWRIMNDESIWVRITDYFPKDEEKDTGGWPVGYGFIWIFVHKNTTVDKIISAQDSTDRVISQSNAVIDGYSSKKLIFNSSIEGESYNVQNLIQKDDSVYTLNLSFNSDTEASVQLQLISIFEQILSTFKFIE